MSSTNKAVGILAEFENPSELLKAAAKIRDAGYKKFDCHTPFPVHGLDAAMGIKHSKLGWIVLCGGITGFLVAITMQWWMSAVDYRVVVSGKPLFSFQAFVPITFELTILFSAFATVFGMLALNVLPQFHHPIFYSDSIARATDDAFFLSISAGDPRFRADETRTLLESIGGCNVEYLIPPASAADNEQEDQHS